MCSARWSAMERHALSMPSCPIDDMFCRRWYNTMEPEPSCSEALDWCRRCERRSEHEGLPELEATSPWSLWQRVEGRLQHQSDKPNALIEPAHRHEDSHDVDLPLPAENTETLPPCRLCRRPCRASSALGWARI